MTGGGGDGLEGAPTEETPGRGDAGAGAGDVPGTAPPGAEENGRELPAAARIRREQLQEWGRVYGTEHRQIRRWIATGREKGEAPPLDEPGRMPDWWGRHMKQRVPEKILVASRAAIVAVAAAALAEGSSPPVASAPPAGGEGEHRASVVLGEYELQEGEAVRQAKRLVAVAYAQLEYAYKEGRDVELPARRHASALAGLDKAEKADRQRAKDQGLLIEKAAIEHDLAQAVELLRQMREAMARRVLELCPELSPEMRTAVSAAILRVRSREDRILQSIETLNQPHELAGLLAA